MIKRTFSSEQYRKMGHPDLNNVMYVMQKKKRVYGIVSHVEFKKDSVIIGIEPFEKFRRGVYDAK